MVSEEVIRKILQADMTPSNCTRELVDIEDSEPIMFNAMTDMCRFCAEGIADQYPVIKKTQPRIFQDIASAGQLIFVRAYKLGRETMREQFDGFFEDTLGIDKESSPESNPSNFK